MEMTITNKKIAGYMPTQWAPYPGFSLLFDNPGDLNIPLKLDGSVYQIKCDYSLSNLELYKELSETLTILKKDLSGSLFCTLPVSSYHVTVLDGFNAGNAGKLAGKEKAAVYGILSNLSKSSNKGLLLNEIITNFSFHMELKQPITFQFHKLNFWGKKVLVACLEPADKDSFRNFKALKKQRLKLLKKIKVRFGVCTAPGEYIPHVSLGYFANEESVKIDSSRLDDLTEFFREKINNTIVFNSISLYGFIDMITFFKTNNSR
jgi:hypothetical protein